jgi:putative effector of murein hydrolase
MKAIAHPLFFIAVTICAYSFAVWLFNRSDKFVLFHPVLIAALLVVTFLYFAGISFISYQEQTKLLSALLGPTVVALVVPFRESLLAISRAALPLMLTVIVGGASVVFVGYGMGCFLGLQHQMNLSLLTRSSTAPVALAIAEIIGGDPSVTLMGVLITGIVGSSIAPFIFDWIGIRNDAVRGFTLGFTSHAFGVARALQISPEACAFATAGMGLMGLTAAILLPVIF